MQKYKAYLINRRWKEVSKPDQPVAYAWRNHCLCNDQQDPYT